MTDDADVADSRSNVYNHSGHDTKPYCAYFYFATPNGSGGYNVQQYYHDHNQEIIQRKRLIKRLILNAIGPQNDPYPSVPDKNMTRKSYVIIVLESGKFEADNAVTINGYDTAGKNYTFRDGKDFFIEVDLPGGRTKEFSGVYFKNHMKRNGMGDDLDSREKQAFHFDYQVEHRPKKRRPPDSGGTNLGPPVGPPY